MGRFSCFLANLKLKKTVEPSVEAIYKTLQDISEIQPQKDLTDPIILEEVVVETNRCQIGNSAKPGASSISVLRSCKSEELKGKFSFENDVEVCQTGPLKKSQSLGRGLFLEGKVPGENNIEGDADQGCSSDSHYQNGFLVPDGSKDPVESSPSQCQRALPSDSAQVSSDLVNNESIFSIGDPQHSENEGNEYSSIPLSVEGADNSGNLLPPTSPVIMKSYSLTDVGAERNSSGGHSQFKYLAVQSRSSEDLHVLDMRRKEMSEREVEVQVIQEEHGDDPVCGREKHNFENFVDDGFDSYNFSNSAKDWIVPIAYEVNSVKNSQVESSVERCLDLPSKDFKIKRIEEWVNNLQYCSPLEETNEISYSDDQVKKDSKLLNGSATSTMDDKVTPGLEAAKRYISSLSATATTVQLANHGLVVIPFLSAFVSVRLLNLSGNSIVRITAGALPRGLHTLNLSKNNISTIEGLRELTRLRVLDLSYNRIFRIGHGLASCSSLKELYLAGNKISEVEGLHRLLKLSVLDLRFNKISTAKCFGQLAANYNSLQAISLEGNPAQKNVGDEQLKKYLQGLLPHLSYFNRQPIRASTLKDASERSVRLGISNHQIDRGLRSDHKATRKSSHVAAAHRLSSSSIHVRKSQAVLSPKRSKGRHGHLPPTGTKATANHRPHYFDFGSKLLNFRSEFSLHRSRSEGTLGAL